MFIQTRPRFFLFDGPCSSSSRRRLVLLSVALAVLDPLRGPRTADLPTTLLDAASMQGTPR